MRAAAAGVRQAEGLKPRSRPLSGAVKRGGESHRAEAVARH